MTHAPVEAARSIRNAVERINSSYCPYHFQLLEKFPLYRMGERGYNTNCRKR